MDEIKEAKKDSLQEPGKAPASGDEITPEPEVYTKTQLEVALQKDRIDKGRDAKSLEVRETAVKAREDATKAEQERRDAAELAEAQKDPDKLAAYQAGKADRDRAKGLDEREANLTRDKADHEAEITASKETQREIVIFEIATAKGVDPVRLKTLSDKFNIEGKEKLEELATEIASGKPKPGDKDSVEYGKIVEDFGSNSAEAKLWRLEHPNFEADNALTKGGSGEKSEEQRLKERYPTM